MGHRKVAVIGSPATCSVFPQMLRELVVSKGNKDAYLLHGGYWTLMM
jgi:hypothetical protein